MPISGQPLDGLLTADFGQCCHLAEEPASLDLVGSSAATRRLRLQIDRIGAHFRTVLLLGEGGSGKELTARALHARSGGTGASFVQFHRASLTGDGQHFFAANSPWSRISAQRNTTLFLDSIDEMPLRAQSRLLEILDEQRPGHASPKIIAATCQSLQRMVAAGRFRPDLYYRLAAIEIVIEPLRKRRDDIPALARHMVQRLSSLYGKGELTLTDGALQLLKEHNWPGNVREMENTLCNGVLACDESTLEPQHLKIPEFAKPLDDTDADNKQSRLTRLQDVVNQHVLTVLQRCSGNKVRAAEMLGISRSTLYRMLDDSAMREAAHRT